MSEAETRSELSPRSLQRSPEPSPDGLGGTGQGTEAPEKASRFRIFIVDSGLEFASAKSSAR